MNATLGVYPVRSQVVITACRRRWTDDRPHADCSHSTFDVVLSRSMDACRCSGIQPGDRNDGTGARPFQQGAVVEVDQATVNQIMDAFHKADAAIAAEDLDGVMVLYSTQYNYHGLKQADIRKIWSDLFEEYRDLGRSISFRRSPRWDRAPTPSSKSPARGSCRASRRPAASGCRSTAGMKKSIF